MATLQAARAYELGLPKETAFSWGLNRAIFYAAAKRGFKGASRGRHEPSGKPIPENEEVGVYHLGDEMAFKEEKDGRTYFTIGGKVQTETDFEKQIESRFGRNFEEAWVEALSFVRMFDRETLLSGSRFYQTVYRPKRDELAKKWSDIPPEGKEEPNGRK